MKKICILLFFVTVLVLNSNAQFRLESNGEVRLWTNNMGPWDNTFRTYANNDYSKCYIVARGSSEKFYVTGNGQTWSTGYHTISDKRFKKDISDITNVERLYNLQAKTYRYKDDFDDSTSVQFSNNNSDSAKIEKLNSKQFGFIAQDVKELFPEMIFEDENGYLAINYTEFIPLIIEAAKQQKNQIETLQKIVYSQEQELLQLKRTVDNCCENENKSKLKSSLIADETTSIDETISENAKLFDNVPNPFSLNTVIKFEIPENSTSAKLIIHDMQGVELKSFDITQKGFSSISINGSELKAGMYLYTLLIDKKIIDTKRMLLTKE